MTTRHILSGRTKTDAPKCRVVDIEIRSPVDAQISLLALPAGSCVNLLVHQIKVGGQEQLIGGSVPGEMFSDRIDFVFPSIVAGNFIRKGQSVVIRLNRIPTRPRLTFAVRNRRFRTSEVRSGGASRRRPLVAALLLYVLQAPTCHVRLP